MDGATVPRAKLVVPRLAVGVLALGFLVATELTVVASLRGLTFAEYVRGRDPLAGGVYVVLLLLFASMPLLVGKMRAGAAS